MGKRREGTKRDGETKERLLSFLRLHRTAALGALAALVTGGAIAANALFLQPHPHPAPLFGTAPLETEAEAPPGEPPRPSPLSLPRDQESDALGALLARTMQTGPAGEDASALGKIQALLAALGYYQGAIDGMDGPMTQAALRRFEEKTGQQLIGKPRKAIIAVLEKAHPKSLAPHAQHDASLAAVQKALDLLGYGPLEASGVWSEETRAAIRRFEESRGLAPSGALSETLTAELTRIGGFSVE